MIREIELEAMLPLVKWKEPIMIRILGSPVQKFGCRFCIAMKGLTAWQVGFLPRTHEEWQRHMEEVHNLEQT